MISRERVLAVLNGEKPDRIPVDLWYTEEVAQDLKNYLKAESDFDVYKALNLDKIVWVFPGYKNPYDDTESGSQVGAQMSVSRTMWGVPLKTVKSGKAMYQEFGEPPLKNYDTAGSIESYPYWPRPENFEYPKAKALAQKASKNYATLGPWISFFEVYCQMRGLQQALIDLVLEPELAHTILDKIEDCQTEMLKNYLDKLGDTIDMVFVSDDMGTQESLLISPEIWGKYFKTRMTRWCELIHAYNKKVFYHSDGDVEPLVPALIETGIDVLNPIQHVCKGMEMAKLKKKYGSKIVFHGGVDNQSVLPFGTPDEVKAETQRCMDLLGSDGKGYIVCSCHNVQAGTPVENIISMIDTVQNDKRE